MTRAEFEHAIRAAGGILGTRELMVIGSQAIHATISGEIPEAAQRSIEVDVVAFDDSDGRKSDLIDGSIGEASMFHATFGYYAQGVSESTAVLPEASSPPPKPTCEYPVDNQVNPQRRVASAVEICGERIGRAREVVRGETHKKVGQDLS